MSGAICFAYPEARKAVIDMNVKVAIDSKYDGIMFHTYIEEFSARFDDEFGFNEPIVKEFKKRYGIDIRSQEFDPNDLASLRGEYLTQFLRELKVDLSKHNIKLGLFLDPENPDLPQRRSAGKQILCTGRIHIDWRRYIREGIVDELMVYCISQRHVTRQYQ